MTPEPLNLLPNPRKITTLDEKYILPQEGLILLDALPPQLLMPAAARFERHLWDQLGVNWDTVASKSVPREQVHLALRIAPELCPQVQGYRLHIRPDGIAIDGHDVPGVFYGVATLIQVMRQAGKGMPCVEIQDWPDFPARGVMLDITRDKVYRMETLYELVDRLAGWKINQLQLYTEHTFAYQNHPEVWKDASPMTGEEILALDHYCQERCIELVPNQNSFGHLTRWLELPRYQHLAEISGEFEAPWGMVKGPFSLAPVLPESLQFIRSLYDELLPHFNSSMVNIGCDETFDIGKGKSKVACEEKGAGRVYLDFLLGLYADLTKRGKTVQFWGDIIIQHPELVGELPRDMIALEWGYEAGHPFDEHGKAFAASGIPFYVCPGTSSWNTLAGRTDNCIENLRNAARNGLANGAIGYLNTDWGDSGHWQAPPVSLLGLAMGAAYSWAYEANHGLDVSAAVSRHAFDDPTGAMGKLVYELGNVYRFAGYEPENASALWGILQFSLQEVAAHPGLNPDALKTCLGKIDEAMALLAHERMARGDAAIIRQEMSSTARLMRHACHRGLLACGSDLAPSREGLAQDMESFLETYRSQWLRRNRPGGLDDSTARFEALIQEYRG